MSGTDPHLDGHSLELSPSTITEQPQLRGRRIEVKRDKGAGKGTAATGIDPYTGSRQ